MLTSTRPIPLEIVAPRRPPLSPGCGDVMREVEFRLAALAATGKRPPSTYAGGICGP